MRDLMALWLLLASALTMSLSACGGIAFTVEEARATACIELDDMVADSYEAGELTQEEATQKIHAVREACDVLHGVALDLLPEGSDD